jgi:ribosome-binding protein aMBF1 (putative translation factor)
MRQQRIPHALDEHKRAQKSFGRAVRELRITRGFSQEGLGFRSDLHRNYVGAIERGQINPTFRVLLKLSGGLHVPLSALIVRFEQRHEFRDAPHRWIHHRLGPGDAHISGTPQATSAGSSPEPAQMPHPTC